MTIHTLVSRRSLQRAHSPRLTIGIPTWNRSARLDAQLQAIAQGLTDDVEVVVCDNGSSDDTWLILQRWVEADEFALRCVRNAINLGADVNYLRVIEAASGEWLWFVGDDDPIDFQVLPFLMDHLRQAPTDLMLLLDTREGFHPAPWTVEAIGPADFFEPRRDLLGQQFLQVGRVLCRVAPAQSHLRSAYAVGVGDLHAYAMVYAPLLLDLGLVVATLPLMSGNTDKAEADVPRWNLLKGHIGAWKSSLLAFRAHAPQASARERRTRSKSLLVYVMSQLANGRSPAREDLIWMLRSFDLKGGLLLIGILATFKLSRRFAITILSVVTPGLALKIQAPLQALEPGY